MYIRCDGCALGYRDRESGLPYRKPMGIVTSMVSAVSILGNLRCQGCLSHQQLEGNNKYGTRTAQAAEWPEELDKLVTDVIAQQVLIDEAEDSIEAFPLGIAAELPVPRPIPGRFKLWPRFLTRNAAGLDRRSLSARQRLTLEKRRRRHLWKNRVHP